MNTIQDEMCLNYVFFYPARAPTACFDLTGAQNPVLAAWTKLNKGQPLNVATCLRLPDYSEATASGQFNRVVVERGMIVETPEPERRFTRVSNLSASERIGNSSSSSAARRHEEKKKKKGEEKDEEEIVWDPACVT